MSDATAPVLVQDRQGDTGASRVSATETDFVLNLSEIARLIRQGLWVIVASTLICGLIAAYLVLQVTPTFTATAQILLGQQSRADDALGNLFEGLDLDNQEIAGQIAIMNSAPILTRVSERLKLAERPEFNDELLPEEEPPGLIARSLIAAEDFVKRLLGAQPPSENTTGSGTGGAKSTDPIVAAAEAERSRLRDQDNYVGKIEAGLRVRQEGGTALINISYASTDRVIAAAVANTVADEYIAFQLGEKFGATRRVTDGLNERIENLELRLEASERAVLEFRDKMLGTESGGSERLEQQIKELSSRLVAVSAERAEIDAELRQITTLIENDGTLAVAGVLDSEVIKNLQQEQSELQLREEQLRSRFGDENPRLKEVSDSISQVEAAMDREITRLQGRLASQVDVAAAREQSIRDQLSGLEQKYLTLSQQLIELAQLEREAEASRLVYETFLTTFTQTSEVVDLQEADARVISYAKPPAAPSAPNKKVSVALGLIAGLFLGLGLVFLRALLDNSIDTIDKLRRIMGIIPVAATIPLVRNGFRRIDPIKDLRDPKARPLVEGMSKLRNTLLVGRGSQLRSQSEGMIQSAQTGNRNAIARKVAVVSATAAEGKTTTSLLLANASALAGKRCIVVETDFRKGSISSLLDLDESPDLLDTLSGKVPLQDAIKTDKETGISVLSARVGISDPGGVLLSKEMKRLIGVLEAKYDMIVFDTAPLLSVSDALPVLQYADDVVMVVRWRRSKSQNVIDCLNMLRETGVTVSCAVMTMTKGRMFQGYGRYYGYGTPSPQP